MNLGLLKMKVSSNLNIKKCISTLLILLHLFLGGYAQVKVSGYYRKDVTYVYSHTTDLIQTGIPITTIVTLGM